MNVAMRMMMMGRQERMGAARGVRPGPVTEVVEHDNSATGFGSSQRR